MTSDTERRTHIADMEIVKQIENLCGGPKFVLTRHDEVVAVMAIPPVAVGIREAVDRFSGVS